MKRRLKTEEKPLRLKTNALESRTHFSQEKHRLTRQERLKSPLDIRLKKCKIFQNKFKLYCEKLTKNSEHPEGSFRAHKNASDVRI